MRNLKRNAAISGTVAILVAVGVGGAVTAQASDNSASIIQQSDGDGETDDAEEVEGVEEIDDGANEGPDANLSEPGHQDVDESGERSGGDEGE